LDGNLFLYVLFSVKDSEEDVREMTPEEKRKYEKQSHSFVTGYKFEKPKEKAVKINVKKQNNHVDELTESIENLKIQKNN
jgi:hypothetical protein